jgi:hypothetical protein
MDFWANVGVDVETAAATGITINAISKANPGVVTYTGTDPANGDYVRFSVAGMVELHERIGRVANVNAGSNTFEIEGENTTNYETFTSGTFSVLTFGVSMSNVQDVNVSGGEPEFADITTIHDQVRRRVPTVVSPFSLAFGCLFAPTDSAMIELKEATTELTKRAVRLRFASGSKMAFDSYVSAAGIPTGAAQDVVKTNVSLEAQGVPSIWST